MRPDHPAGILEIRGSGCGQHTRAQAQVHHGQQGRALEDLPRARRELGLVVGDAGSQAELRQHGLQPTGELVEHRGRLLAAGEIEGDRRFEAGRAERQREGHRPVDIAQCQLHRTARGHAGLHAHVAVGQHVGAAAFQPPGVRLCEGAQLPFGPRRAGQLRHFGGCLLLCLAETRESKA
jgi:hypothetical protein